MARTVLEALTRRRFLLTAWPWRGLGYVVSTAPVMLAALLLAVPGLPWIALLSAVFEGRPPALGEFVGLALLGGVLIAGLGPLVTIPLGALERRRLSLVDTRAAVSGHRVPPGPRLMSWLRTRYTEAATWRALGYGCLALTLIPVLYGVALSTVVLVGSFLAAPVLVSGGTPVALGWARVATPGQALPFALAGLALLPAVPYLLGLLAGTHAAMARALLTTTARAELVEMSRSRARLVDAFEAERRRIERDLHDIAQQRLVGLTLHLGLARLDLPPGSPAAGALAGAHEQAKRLMAELRDLIHGIHPQVLTDLGLPAALPALADRAGIPVAVRVDLPERPPRQVETTAYFVTAEALANIGKHSGASAAEVSVRRDGDLLVVEITDNGRGGATPGRGSGLTGLADRIAVVDGRLWLSSPVGGPTVLRAELPCRSG
ncbi:sensor domain-containing protein [Amycolatopsis cynarae]|uniref:histidine kinase n=1 Tax=Amycolatopsis cynarae TaxID=2995223 RepID=A0ABY7B146_9PSEU|nr:sensor histidine kinase [Amycolatopsis sp. HUAS 11-8]WAL64636.1 sensor domain-containing protein [Amycolatopsis sp. HUAS 11-8]